MITLGYDIGSSSVKGTLYDVESGNEIASSFYPKHEMKIDSPQRSWAEQNPMVWWESIKAVTAELLKASGKNSSDIKAIGISYQMHGLVITDKNNEVLRPSIIWCDSRAVEIGNDAFNKIGQQKCLNSLLNSPGNFTASKLAWVKQNEPGVYSKINKAMLPGDFIAMMLTGETRTTLSGLSEGIFWDFEKDEKSETILSHYGFDKSILADIVPTFGLQGEVNAWAAAETGLKAGTPVTYRAGDQPNNAFSLNVLNPGEVAATAGTSGVVYGISDTLKYDNLNRVNTFAHVNHSQKDKRLGILLCINGTGISNSWIRKTVFDQNFSYKEMDRLSETINIGSDGAVFLPFGNGAERMLQNTELGAGFSGVNFNLHEKAHLVRAMFEGIGFSFIYGMEIMQNLGVNPKIIRAGKDNMFLSPVFRKTIASISGAEIQLYNTNGALGAARAAAYGAGFYSSLKDAFENLKCLETVYPDMPKKNEYIDAYKKWKNELEIKLTNRR
ncbi:MAG: carbohydrate kinase [Ignavibacteria bacterium]|nr:carbohydrate kinase [Ignavibacteria bacterium]